MSGMTDLDRAIAATLRAEAREAEMRTETPQQYEELSSRLDDVDRSRTRTRWTVGLVAVAAVALLVVGLAVVRPFATASTPPASTPSPSTPSAQAEANPLVGTWTATMTRDQITATLADAGLSASTPRVLSELVPAGDPMTWELWIDGSWYRLYLVEPGGKKTVYDQHTYMLNGSTVTGTTADGQNLATVSTATVDGTTLTWSVLSSTEGAADGIPEKAMQLALYSTSTWERGSV